jgi:predicted O-methyltransferase YrrM
MGEYIGSGMGWKQVLLSVYGVSEEALNTFVGEASKINLWVTRELGGRRLWAIDEDERNALYCVTKVVNPRVAVETGVGPGVSTTFILSALSDGVLHSFDLGVKYGDEVVEYPVGFIVPTELRHKWRLHVGDSKLLLGPFFEALGSQKIQLFLHDGEHTYTNVYSELETAWEHMDWGAIVVDNYDWTEAPLRFAERFEAKVHHLTGDMCLIPKTGG